MHAPQENKPRLLGVLQFWHADLAQMNGLMNLMADLAQSYAPRIDFLLYPRYDTNIRELTALKALEKAFNVGGMRSRRQRSGWPYGPNAQAMDAFMDVRKLYDDGNFPYAGALLMEADCVPLTLSWADDILDEFVASGKLASGHWDGSRDGNPPSSHMNGNLIFHPKLVHEIPELADGEVPMWGWDMHFWSRIRPFAHPSRLIYSDYRLNTPDNPLLGCNHLFAPRKHTHPDNPLSGQELKPSWLHGIKGTAGIDCVRSKLLA